MTAACSAGAPCSRQRLVCQTRVIQPNWKAECGESRTLRLEGGKGCKVLPILTWMGAISSGYPGVPSMFNSLEVQVLYPT